MKFPREPAVPTETREIRDSSKYVHIKEFWGYDRNRDIIGVKILEGSRFMSPKIKRLKALAVGRFAPL